VNENLRRFAKTLRRRSSLYQSTHALSLILTPYEQQQQQQQQEK